MAELKEVSRSIVVDDNVNLTLLSFPDMIRLVISTFNHDEAAELETEEKLSKERLRKLGSLDDFFRRATNKMEKLHKTSATLNLSSSYLPYIDEVIDAKKGWGRFYDITYQKRDIPADIKHKFICVIRKRT